LLDVGVLCAGLVTVDVVQAVDRLPRANQKMVASEVSMTYGGPAANAAGVVAGLGVVSMLVSVIGRSPFAQAVLDELSRSGVAVLDIAPDLDDALPLSTVLVDRRSGERAVVSTNAVYSARANAAQLAWLDSAKACLVDGHNMPLCIQVASAARALGIPVVLDGGSWKEGTEDLLPFVDLAVVSADFYPPGEKDTLDFLVGAGCRFAAQSFGADSMQALIAGKRTAIEVPRVEVRDTLGAGDALHGAIVAAIAQSGLAESTMVDVLCFGVEVASASCTRFGARGWLEDDVLKEWAGQSLLRLIDRVRRN
jgi:sugar/nucleoside kinase (ribokinase family)